MAEESYPDELRYHPEHDWARVEGDGGDLRRSPGTRRTRSARSSSTSRPRSARRWPRTQAYAEVESVKAVSDVYAPLSGEIVAVNEAVAEQPELINEDPYGEGWLVRVKLSDPSEVEELLDAEAYRKLLAERTEVRAADRACPGGSLASWPALMCRQRARLDPLHLSHRRRPPGDARGDRRRLDRRPVRRDPRRAAARSPARPARRASRRPSASTTWPRSRSATPTPTPSSASSARGCTTTTRRRSSTRSPSARSS